MLSNYANQSIPYQKRLGVLPNGQQQYADPEPIDVRIEYGNKLTRNEKGEEVTATAMIMTPCKLELGDALGTDRGVLVILEVNPIYGLGGLISHYEGYA